MADTKQNVRWRLAFNCPLRRHDEWNNEALFRARTYDLCRDPEHKLYGVWDGICVTSVSKVEPWSGGTKVPIPYEGFALKEAFAGAGGAEGLIQTCGDCPANAALEGLAGCSGWIPCNPYNSELDEKLRVILQDLHLEEAAARIFPPTGLLWFGFWVESPLCKPAMEILHPVLDTYAEREFLGREYQQHRELVGVFLRALERSHHYDIPLHVQLVPPGHVDMGWRRAFAHCPRCKAVAPGPQEWEAPAGSNVCSMCFQEYDPAKTCSVVPEPNHDPYPLRMQMGDARYRSFAVNFLIYKGRRRDLAESAVDRYLALTRA